MNPTIHLRQALRLLAMPFKWKPKDVGDQYKGIREYPGFHTTDDFQIAAMYAVGRVSQSYEEEDENGVAYVTDYPVVVSVDMAGFEPKVDYDAVEMVLDNMKIQLDEFVHHEIRDTDTDDDIKDKLSQYTDMMEEYRETPDEALDFLSNDTFAHFETPLRYLSDLPNAPQIIREYQQTGQIPDDVLMKATEQYRYTEDISEGRIQKVWYIRPVANVIETYEDEEGAYEAKYPGFDIPCEDDIYGGYWSPTEQLVYESTPHEQLGLPGVPDPDRREEYHGTTYQRLLQIAPELNLPAPPSPPYRE